MPIITILDEATTGAPAPGWAGAAAGRDPGHLPQARPLVGG
ncbi:MULTISPECIES: hypothetical protein [Actinoplanes]|nr:MULTISPECIES: hypothetical protein [Actinoplanes]